MKITFYTLDAFAKAPNGGNPAGVLLDSDSLSDNDKQKIAKKLGFSETAFVQKSVEADYKLQFFTPEKEVDLCGHATIAAFSLLFQKKLIKQGDFSQETKAGILKIRVSENGLVYMNQKLPQFGEIIDKEELANCLQISIEDMLKELPAQVVSTGGIDVFIPIKHLSTELSLKPDLDKVLSTSINHQLEGFCPFTLETKFGTTAHSRSFAPAVGIPEDPACGVQAGALACYLYKYGLISNQQSQNLVFEQGYSVNRPSEVFVSLTTQDTAITEVLVGGKALNIKELELEI